MENSGHGQDPFDDMDASADGAASDGINDASAINMDAFEEQFAQEFKPQPRTGPRHGGSIMMAAMLGLAEALGWDPEPTEITQPAAPSGEPGIDLTFGDLPPLD